MLLNAKYYEMKQSESVKKEKKMILNLITNGSYVQIHNYYYPPLFFSLTSNLMLLNAKKL